MTQQPPTNDTDHVKIMVEDLEIGMYMTQPDRPWLETSFLFQGFLLDSEELINQVKEECDFIFVDVDKSLLRKGLIMEKRAETVHKPDKKRAVPQQSKKDSRTKEEENFKPIEEEIGSAYRKHHAALSQIKEALTSIQSGEGFNVTKIRGTVKTCVESITENPNAMLWLAKLRNRDSYTAEHCLNVGILAIALGRHLGLDRGPLETLGLCGMLHDVGKMKLDQSVLNKPGRLTEDEFEIIKTHCAHGRKILLKDGNIPQVSIEAAFSHHERIDGKGYPKGTAAGTLHLYTRIISIVDTYDAITTNRCYDNSRPATEAIKILFSMRDTQFDGWLVEQFIECLGIYPTGSLVELQSREGAVVIDSNRTSRLHPKVAIVLDENKRSCKPLVVDTRAYLDTKGERTIKNVLDENEFRIDLEYVFSHFRT